MEKITCIGIKQKKELKLVCTRENRPDRWSVTVNGKRNESAEMFVNVFAEIGIPFAGTYCPEDEKSVYYAMSAVESYFDSRAIFTELVTDERMPGEAGVVY